MKDDSKATGVDLLKEIKPAAPRRRFLQNWDSDAKILRFGFGDERTGLWVRSDGPVEAADTAKVTKLGPSTVSNFIDGAKPDAPFKKVRDVLLGYLVLPDERLVSLFAVWIAGTYVYSIFSHYGYLFLFSNNPRCGKRVPKK